MDDGSTDETKTVVASCKDPRIRYFFTSINSGAGAARNFGIKNAAEDSDFIAFEDSNDQWHRDKLEKGLEAFEKDPDAGFCYHKIRYDMGKGYSAILPDERIPLEKKSGDIYAQLLYDNMVDCPAMLIKRELVRELGGFDESLKALEDYDLALRMAKRKRALFVDKVLLESTYSTTGVSGNSVNYLISSCRILAAYKEDYLATKTFDHRMEIILRDAKSVGVEEQIVELMSKLLKL